MQKIEKGLEMERQKVIAFDFNGVLANSVAAKRSALSHVTGKKLELSHAVNGSFKYRFTGDVYSKAMDRLYTTEHFFDWMKPFEGVGRLLRRLAREGYLIKIVSKVKGLTKQFLLRWCQKYDLPVKEENIFTVQRDKRPHYSTADIVVEDTLYHLMLHENEPGKRLILYRDEVFAEDITPRDHPFEEVHRWIDLWHCLFGEPQKMETAA